MKKLVKILAVLPLFAALAANAAVITIGENAIDSGYMTGNPLYTQLTYTMEANPWGGGFSNPVLRYDLPAGYTGALAGDIQVKDPWEPAYPTAGSVGDILRFDGSGHLYFLSLIDDNCPLEGANQPTNFFNFVRDNPLANLVVRDEQSIGGEANGHNPGPYGSNWLSYAPTYPEPGYAGAGNDYLFISDVPEPSSVILSLVVLAGAAGYGVRRHRRSRNG